MVGSVRELSPSGAEVVTVSFGERYASSAAFAAVYRDGMSLVEETAAYLDGAGRQDAKALKGALTLAYATESMRLTTRLMQLASWLLIRKAVNDGEMTREDAVVERRKVRFTSVGRPSHTKEFELLPARLRSFVERSFMLHDRVSRLDQVISGERSVMNDAEGVQRRAPELHNALDAQQQRLQAAFSTADTAKRRPLS